MVVIPISATNCTTNSFFKEGCSRSELSICDVNAFLKNNVYLYALRKSLCFMVRTFNCLFTGWLCNPRVPVFSCILRIEFKIPYLSWMLGLQLYFHTDRNAGSDIQGCDYRGGLDTKSFSAGGLRPHGAQTRARSWRKLYGLSPAL